MSRVTILMAAGMTIEAAASLWMSRYISTLLFGLDARDPRTLVAAAGVLALVGVAAGWIPARRASMIDPSEVLRNN
jgi:ABC-type lipoprotein release transport system permease subunit